MPMLNANLVYTRVGRDIRIFSCLVFVTYLQKFAFGSQCLDSKTVRLFQSLRSKTQIVPIGQKIPA